MPDRIFQGHHIESLLKGCLISCLWFPVTTHSNPHCCGDQDSIFQQFHSLCQKINSEALSSDTTHSPLCNVCMPAPHAPLQRCFIYGIHPQSTIPCGVGTPAPSCWGSAAPAQTVGAYRDFQEQTNGDEHRWPLQHQVSQILVSCKCFRACPQRTFTVHCPQDLHCE